MGDLRDFGKMSLSLKCNNAVHESSMFAERRLPPLLQTRALPIHEIGCWALRSQIGVRWLWYLKGNTEWSRDWCFHIQLGAKGDPIPSCHIQRRSKSSSNIRLSRTLMSSSWRGTLWPHISRTDDRDRCLYGLHFISCNFLE